MSKQVIRDEAGYQGAIIERVGAAPAAAPETADSVGYDDAFDCDAQDPSDGEVDEGCFAHMKTPGQERAAEAAALRICVDYAVYLATPVVMKAILFGIEPHLYACAVHKLIDDVVLIRAFGYDRLSRGKSPDNFDYGQREWLGARLVVEWTLAHLTATGFFRQQSTLGVKVALLDKQSSLAVYQAEFKRVQECSSGTGED